MRWLSACVLTCLLCPFAAWGQTAAEKKATVAYLRSLQSESGGFWPIKPDPSKARAQPPPTLRATSAALRVLKYFGGEARDRKAAARFVARCFHESSGGFRSSPTAGRPDVITTAVGLMAVVELKMPAQKYTDKAVKYLEKNARTFEEVRLAAAGLEAVHKQPANRDWLKQVLKLRKEDGSYGTGSGAARDTGSAVVTVLRLNGEVGHRTRVREVLKKGQRKDGAFGKAGENGSDLETTYRVMRAFVMLKEKPADPRAVRAFVAKCRNKDGGYGVSPGTASDVSGTYFASVILHWLDGR
jgi:hypothetical protein